MSINRLKANDDKTAIVIVRKKKSDETLTVTIGNEEITEKKEEKLLGITIQSDLKWDNHIKNLTRKLNFRLFTLRRINEKLPKFLLKRVAEAIFMSHVRYGLPLYCPVKIDESDPTPGCLDALKVAFNDCLRLLLGIHGTDHESIKNMLDELG